MKNEFEMIKVSFFYVNDTARSFSVEKNIIKDLKNIRKDQFNWSLNYIFGDMLKKSIEEHYGYSFDGKGLSMAVSKYNKKNGELNNNTVKSIDIENKMMPVTLPSNNMQM